MQVAFYKGKERGSAGIIDRLIRWWTDGPYSHCELVFSDGLCASSSNADGGVRFKRIDLTPEDWDVIDIAGDEAEARKWFYAHAGALYYLLGDFGFVWRPIRGSKTRFFCSEAVGYALGMSEPWQFNPNTLYIELHNARCAREVA